MSTFFKRLACVGAPKNKLYEMGHCNDHPQENPRMASGPPKYHMDRVGRRLADRSCNFVLAAEKRLGRLSLACNQITARLPQEAERAGDLIFST
jgi:hypothetical protein